MTIYYNPPKTCDLCDNKIEDEFSDARISGTTWGNVCNPCAKRYGVQYGTGRGQRYRLNHVDGKFHKVEG